MCAVRPSPRDQPPNPQPSDTAHGGPRDWTGTPPVGDPVIDGIRQRRWPLAPWLPTGGHHD